MSEEEVESKVSAAVEEPEVSEVSVDKHMLQHTWTMWYDAPKRSNPSNWHVNVKKIVSFNSVEDFWW